MKPDIKKEAFQPLAARLRPKSIDEFIGQMHLLGKNKPLRLAIEQGVLHSMILWGPPGVGKTTLARLMAENANARFEKLSAIFSGVKDIRAVVERQFYLSTRYIVLIRRNKMLSCLMWKTAL
jgi:putative ATPase